MKIVRAAAVLAVVAWSTRAEEITLQVDPAATRVTWTLSASLHTVHGTFKLKRGELSFDPESGKAAGIFIVDATSGESGNNGRDAKMHQTVLESAQYPEITFRPERFEGKVKPQGESDVLLHGTFEIHGARHPLAAKVHSRGDQGKVEATIQFTVPYVDWGMKNPSTFFLKVSQSVMIEIQTLAGTATR